MVLELSAKKVSIAGGVNGSQYLTLSYTPSDSQQLPHEAKVIQSVFMFFDEPIACKFVCLVATYI